MYGQPPLTSPQFHVTLPMKPWSGSFHPMLRKYVNLDRKKKRTGREVLEHRYLLREGKPKLGTKE